MVGSWLPCKKGLVQPGEETALGETNSSRVVIKEMEPGSSQWCMVGE